MSPEPPVVILTDESPNSPQDPPPPYPSRDRRHRRRRMTVEASSADSDEATIPSSVHAHMYAHAGETTPLLGVSSPTRRPRTMSLSSVASVSPSLAQTVASAFRMDLDSDVEDEDQGPPTDDTPPDDDPTDSAGVARRRAPRGWGAKWRHYFRPMGRRVYWSALLHLLVFNFPYALFAWIYLFVFTLLGTILLVALPLGAVLCFFDLLGARALARGEVALQRTFHGPLAYPLDGHVYPIFTRLRMPTPEEVEAGFGARRERSFYRNSFSMFTDPTSYQALFYFLVIKPGITILLSLLVIVIVPVSLSLVIPVPAMLRFVRRLGTWQANVAVEGLYLGGG